MEKRISFSHFQQAKNVAKTIDPNLRQKAKIQARIDNLEAEYVAKAEEGLAKLKQRLAEDMKKKKASLEAEIKAQDDEIALFEAGIVERIGCHVVDIVKKVIEPTGKIDANGKPQTVTKYIPTDIVSYDEETKEYVITLPDVETIEVPTTENKPGSDFDADAENTQQEVPGQEENTVNHAEAPVENEETTTATADDNNKLPWEQQ